MLISCKGSAESQVTKKEAADNDDKQAMKKWAGTYVGSQGTAFTLSEDGTARVFCAGSFQDVDEEASWTVEDDILTINSKTLGYEIYSNTQKADHNRMEFLSKDTNWNDEWFMKRRKEEKEYSKEDYLALLDDTAFEFEKIPEKESYTYDEIQTIEYEGVAFDLPVEFEEEKSEDGREFYLIEDDEEDSFQVRLLALNESVEDGEEFEEYKYILLDNVMMALGGRGSRLINVKNVQVNGLEARVCTIYSTIEDESFYIRYAGIENGKDLFQIGIFQSVDSKFDYTECFNEILSSVRESDSKGITKAFGKKQDVEKKEENTEVEPAREEKSEDKKKDSAGLRPDIKEAIDSYEEFMDEYIELMQEIGKNPSDMAILAKYTEFATKSLDVSEKFEALEDEDLTDEELRYYTEVALRVEGKMLKALN